MKVTEKTDFHSFEKGKHAEAGKKRKGPVTEVRVKKAGKGYVSEAHHENMGPEQYMPGQVTKKAHPTVEHAAKHMGKMFGETPAIDSTPEMAEQNAAAGAPEPGSTAG